MSTSDSYWQIKDLFAQAIDKPRDERDAFIRCACNGDGMVADEVRALLAAHELVDVDERIAGNDSPPPPPAFDFRLPADSPGTVIGPYTLLEVIGEGGMGTVHKAEQHRPIHRIVALKLIKLGMDTRQVIARFDSERQALAMMSHPNVATVYDAGATAAGRPYFVMEYVPGTPITTFCQEQNYTTRQRLELFVQACDAVQHAHQKAVIHRDLKPSNILVMAGDNGVPIVKVIDFGVAKATSQRRLTEQTLHTETGQLVGTPEYMSPEQAQTNGLDVDTRADIYSLGVVLYELLAGALPFDSEQLRQGNYTDIQSIIRNLEPPRPSTKVLERARSVSNGADSRSLALAARSLASELRGELEWIPLKAMRKERAERYNTAAELAQDVHNFLQHKPLLAGPESAAYRVRKFLRRNKRPVIASAAVVVVLMAGVIGTTIGLIGQSRQRAIAEQQRAEAERQTAIASAVSEFQSDMLSSADPEKLLGDKVTVVQAVTAAVKELDGGKLNDQPLVEAAVRDTIGRTLRALGRYDAAEPNLRKALELRRAHLKPDDRMIGTSAGNLALLLQAQNNFAEAEPLFREALAIDRARDRPVDLAVSLNNLALMLDHQGKFAAAEPLYRESLDLRRRALSPDDPRVARSLNNLAACLYAQGKLADAEPLYRESLQHLRKRLPPAAPQLGKYINNLAMLLRAQGKLDEAESLAREVLSIQRQSLPAEHPDNAKALVNLGWVLKEQGKLAEAEPLFIEALAINRKAFPQGHGNTAITLNHLGALFEAKGQFAEAEQTYREAVDVSRRSFPAGHPQVATNLMNLGSFAREQRRYSEAEPLYAEALASFEKAHGPNHWKVGACRIGLGRTLAAMQRFAEAERELLEAERVLASDDATAPDRHAKAVEALVELYTAWNAAEPNTYRAAAVNQWQAQRKP